MFSDDFVLWNSLANASTTSGIGVDVVDYTNPGFYWGS